MSVKQKKTLFEWQAASRPFKKRNRDVFLTAGAIVALISVILVFVKEFLLIAVLLSLYFVFWVLNTISPEKVQHRITNQGVETGDEFYKWEELGKFWLSEQWGDQILNIETKKRFPGLLIMILGPVKEEVKKGLSQYLTFEEPEENWLNGAAKWLQKTVPLDKKAPVA